MSTVEIQALKPGDYRCPSCDLILSEPFFCRRGVERFAAAFAYVGLAISEIDKMGFERAKTEYLR